MISRMASLDCSGFIQVCCVTLLMWTFCPRECTAVAIRRLSVPRWVRNGTEDSVILDCEYTYNENDFRLVVKWFFKDNTEPVYQWIPELNRRHISGVLKERVDMDFVVNTADAYSRYRALRIARPTTDLSGKYTCQVTSLAGQDAREQTMIVFVPARQFDLNYLETDKNTVNVTCDARGVFPVPVLRLFLGPSADQLPTALNEVARVSSSGPSGAYDAHLQRTLKINELSRHEATVIECVLELPGTNYVQSKKIVYLPDLNGRRIEASYELSSSTERTIAGLHIFRTVTWFLILKNFM